ncbi:molybdopterin-dependent oxidoreductase [Chloroflexota bacterium]
MASETRVIPVSCTHDCGGRCLLKAHVEGGRITKLEPDDCEEPQLRACARGYASRQRLYAPDRIKYPMKRIGARGEGKFERISWGQALDTVADELKRVKKTYGPTGIFCIPGSGSAGLLHQRGVVERLLNMFGGCITRWGPVSATGSSYSAQVTYGTITTGHSRDDLINSRLIIMWGWNPANTIQSTNTTWYLAKAKEAGAKIVAVDPRLTETAAVFANEWIPIRPGTDAAMLIAMAYVMIKESLQNQVFLNTYTIGFDKYKDYLVGTEDGIPKSPAWANSITGVPAATIEALARKYATIKPAALVAGYAPGRTAYGEQYHRAASVLAAMTGNIGIHGGYPAGHPHAPVGQKPSALYGGGGYGFSKGQNPLEQDAPPVNTLNTSLHRPYRVHSTKCWDALLKGRTGGYPGDFKLVYIFCINVLNQYLNTNKGVEALKKPEFIVVHEQFMTATARFADILLPANTHLERNDIMAAWSAGGPYYVYSNKVIDSLYESKSDFEIAAELAPRLGISNYSDKTEDEWLRGIFEAVAMPGHIDIADYEEFKRKGVYKTRLAEPAIAFREQILDPKNHPFPTPSGKIEIYSQQLADLNDPEIPPIPKYIEAWESRGDPLAKQYPLQLITIHVKNRAHSTFGNTPWLMELEPQVVWLNSSDAQARGIKDGDEVRVFNDRGETAIPTRVTERILPGVVSIGEGGWYAPDKKGTDRGGCPNVLTKDEHSPGGAFASNTCLVQVTRYTER